MKNSKSIPIALAMMTTLQITSFTFTKRAQAETLPLNSTQSRDMRFGDLKNWMSQSWDVIKDKPYRSLSMIGTHDSGTYNLRFLAGTQISNQVYSAMNGLLQSPLAGIVWQAMDGITKNKSILQNTNIYTQLSEGARMLDLRFKRYNGDPFKEGDHELRTFHGEFGDTIDDVISQIRDYLNSSDPREIVYLELNLNGEMWDMPDSDKQEVGQKFKDGLGQYMFTKDEFNLNKSLSELASLGKRLIISDNETVDTTLHATMSGYRPSEVNSGNQDIIQKTLPAVRNQYDAIKNSDKKNSDMLQLKVIMSWDPNTDVAYLKNAAQNLDPIGVYDAIAKLTSESLANKTQQLAPPINDFIKGLARGDNDWQPSIWLTDVTNKTQTVNAISRNLGNNPAQQSITMQKLLADGKTNPTAKAEYDYLKGILLSEKLFTIDMARDGELVQIDPKFDFPATVMGWNFQNVGTQLPQTFGVWSNGNIITKIAIQYDGGTKMESIGSTSGADARFIDFLPGEYLKTVAATGDGPRITSFRANTTFGRSIGLGTTPSNTGFKEEWTAPDGTYIAGFYGTSNESSMTRLAPLYRKIPLMPGESEIKKYGDLAYKTFKMTNQATGKAVELIGDASGGNQGMRVQQWDSNQYIGQLWQFRPAEDGTYYIINARTGFALDEAIDGGYKPGAPIIQFTYRATPNQRWTVIPCNGGYIFKNAASGNVLDIPEYDGRNGVKLDSWTLNYGKNQIFNLINP